MGGARVFKDNHVIEDFMLPMFHCILGMHYGIVTSYDCSILLCKYRPVDTTGLNKNILQNINLLIYIYTLTRHLFHNLYKHS